MKANDTLQDFIGTSAYYRYICGLVLTDGSKALAEKYGCFWFLDIIASYQHELLKNPEYDYQYWYLTKNADDSADVKCFSRPYPTKDIKPLVHQHIELTDFSADEAEIWVKNGVVFLPSED